MEPLLGFKEETVEAYNQDFSSSTIPSNAYKLVPWLNWAEWDSVRKSLFSSSPRKISSALSRISTWRSRGCLPVVIDVTASIVEIQQSDPFFRGDKSKDDSHSEQLLAMLYCMAILRIVNCVIEKTRKRTGISIADAADAIGIPRRLIDVRHEGSHRDLPSLTIARDSSVVALNWLKSYYWEPQKKQIPFQRDGVVNIRREIKSKLRELALCIKIQKNPELKSLLVRGKGGGQFKHLCDRSKFFSLMAGKVNSSQSSGPKKLICKTLKSLVSLYSTSSSEVVSVLLELLLKALDCSSSMDISEDSESGLDRHTALDDWQLVIRKFSNKEPELLLALLQRILYMIGTNEASKSETVGHPTASEGRPEACQVEHVSSLFAWLVRHLELKGKSVSNAILLELLRKCLLVASLRNNHLMDSALHIAQLVGNSVLMEKLNKFRSLGLSNTEVTEENTSNETWGIVSQEEEYLNQAAKKLEVVKLRRTKSTAVKTADDVRNSNRWVVAKSWNPCPLGMLPRTLGSSGRIPLLDCGSDCQKDTEVMEGKNERQLNRRNGKREGSDDIQLMNFSSPKKLKETVENKHEQSSEGVSSSGTCRHLMMDGVWKEVGETEVEAIASAVRILV
ncbi:hypothetical protein E1A91_D03G196700v1 [Gossypium mustelinum]|uniref:Las1-like family protein n=1 Tax=Gossypium mustelinum TaxID=34275 RepID=A0A5D2VR94_GOSMU|nr:hypothetical protein E1A91_D03G196700v1 [Gossypium mustelinum]